MTPGGKGCGRHQPFRVGAPGRRVPRIYGLLALSALLLASLRPGYAPMQPVAVLVSDYRTVFDSVDGRRCPSWPVCSRYAEQSLRRYGPWLGGWMTLDRLIHEHDDLQGGRSILVHGSARIDDPLWRNARWWNLHWR